MNLRGAARWAAVTVSAMVVATGCTVPTSGSSEASSTPLPSTSATAVQPARTSGPVVTVPGLLPPGAATTQSSAGSSSAATVEVPSSAAVSSQASVPASSAPTVAPPVDTGSTATVDLSGICPDCSVISSRAGVQGELAMVVVGMAGGRTAAMAVRADGSTASVLAVPYGVTFPAPPGGLLPCDSGGRCLITAMGTDGNGYGTAIALTADGTLTDVSPPDGFVSVGQPAQIAQLDGEPGIAVLEVPGTAPVWTVYGWSGDGFAPVGCTAGATPDLSALSMELCG